MIILIADRFISVFGNNNRNNNNSVSCNEIMTYNVVALSRIMLTCVARAFPIDSARTIEQRSPQQSACFHVIIFIYKIIARCNIFIELEQVIQRLFLRKDHQTCNKIEINILFKFK